MEFTAGKLQCQNPARTPDFDKRRTYMPDWIPQKDAAFDAHYGNYCRIVNQKTGGSAPEWTHIPAARITGLNDGYAAWFTAYDKLNQSHTHGDVAAKDRARDGGKRTLRAFNNDFILYSTLVSRQDKVDMGNRLRKSPSPILDPGTRPEFSIVLVDIRRLGLHFRDQGSESKAKPYGIAGALIFWAVLDHPPAGIEELTNSFLATRTPAILEFSEQERGKTVYIAMRWQNRKGRVGPASEIQSAIVP
jgi:hypothetical protein